MTTPPPSREPAFDPVHAPLRADVGFLGGLLGEVIREQQGEALLAAVERARALAIERRRSGGSLEALDEALSGLDPEPARGLVEAFSTFFSLTNLAEQVHRIRRRRDYQIEGRLQPGSLDASMAALRDLDPHRVRDAIRDLRVIPVFTAHPTEATRRTILKKEQRIARALVDRIEQTRRTPGEDRRLTERIREEVGLIWQTAEQAAVRPRVADEVEHVLFFLIEVIYRIVPAFYEALAEAASRLEGDDEPLEFPHPLLRFGSWVGGDMDGNPNAGAETILATLARHRELILERYRDEVRRLFGHLSQSDSKVETSPELRERVARYRELIPEAAAGIPVRYRDMPYREFLWLVWERLGLARERRPGGYESAAAFLEDLELVDHSLSAHGGTHAGQRLTRRLLVRARTFGFHLATLDLRQDAELHRRVLATLFSDPEFPRRPREERVGRLVEFIGSGERFAANPADDEARRTLAVFRAVAEAGERFGPHAVGPFIISMAGGADDLLAVLALARGAGLTAAGQVPLDVAPLLETVDDLEAAPRIFDGMMSNPVYREHLRGRGDDQMIMLGYSDSAKISGVGASRWALYRAQEMLVEAANRAGVRLTLFHGRGGTIARGGSKPREAILAGPPGGVRGRLRVTEQGEIINSKFGLRGIAERTLELTAGGVLEATLREDAARPLPTAWRETLDRLADASRTAWTALVREDPRFLPYFHAATPIDVIERLFLGSRPASRRSGGGVENLRAIPWVFAWTQSRHLLPAWYGLGAGLAEAEQAFGLDRLREMAREWPFFANLLADAEMALAKADLEIAAVYAGLADDEARTLFPEIRGAFDSTCDRLLRIRETRALLEGEPVLRELIQLRNPYVDPLSLIQVDLLRRWRAGGRRDDALLRVLFNTVRGVARGLRNTG